MSRFSVPIRPRYSEVDRMGIVYHSQYLVYFDIGRTEFLRSRGLPYRQLEDSGCRLVVVDAQVRFRRPARYDDSLTLFVDLERVRPASVDFAYELVAEDGVPLTTGTTRLGCLGSDMEPARLPTHVIEAMRGGSRQGCQPSESPHA